MIIPSQTPSTTSSLPTDNMTLLGQFSIRKLFLISSGVGLFLFLTITLSPIRLTSPLPPYTGLHEVGILDLETPVQQPRTIAQNITIKETGQQGFEFSTLAITLYYPSSPRDPDPAARNLWTSQYEARHWLPRPIWPVGIGYARLAHVYFRPFQHLFTFAMWLLAGRITVPGFVDPPLLAVPEGDKLLLQQSGAGDAPEHIAGGPLESSSEEFDRLSEETIGVKDGGSALPCVIFSHGMAGMSQSYSYYLGSLASRGFVVAAIEHRDGSGPGSLVHLPNGKKKRVWHLNLEDLERIPPLAIEELKVAQLAFREAEIMETVRLFHRLNAGEGQHIKNLKPHSPDSSLSTFKNRLDLDAVTIAGHSYGATGTLQAVKSAPSETHPLNGAIALDPGKESGPLNDDIDIPILVFNSGEWTEKQVQFYGQGWHFDVEKKLVKKADKGWFMTLLGTAHPSCTDAPLIVPWIMRWVMGTTLDPLVALKEYVDVSTEFLNFLRKEQAHGILRQNVTSPNGPLGEASDRKSVQGRQGGRWEVHVVPE